MVSVAEVNLSAEYLCLITFGGSSGISSFLASSSWLAAFARRPLLFIIVILNNAHYPKILFTASQEIRDRRAKLFSLMNTFRVTQQRSYLDTVVYNNRSDHPQTQCCVVACSNRQLHTRLAVTHDQVLTVWLSF